MNIRAGTFNEISWSNGTWLILDIGFSNNKQSSGFLLQDRRPIQLDFHEATEEVCHAAQAETLINLVIEAPLSVGFDSKGNPKGRTVEKRNSQVRYWYFGPGCTVMVATLFLMRKLLDSRPKAAIRLFEAFVSYKDKANRSDHLYDVKIIKDTIQNPGLRQYVKDAIDLKRDNDDVLESIFKVMGMDFGIPPVIQDIKG